MSENRYSTVFFVPGGLLNVNLEKPGQTAEISGIVRGMKTIGNKPVQENVILAPYTTFKIGGPAELFVEVESAHELAEAARWARHQNIPYLVLGLGANILVGDNGVRGLVILNRAEEIAIEGSRITAESGTKVEDLIIATQKQGLSGLEHFAGIPSSVGGALWQNLHFLSPDRERTVFIDEIMESAEILDEQGEVRQVDAGYFQFGYDQSILRDNPGLIVLSATLRLSPEDPAILEERIQANLAWRRERHPNLVEFPSCGSVFKKIEGIGAGRLIEQAGMKGYRIGGAQVSKLHANFIVNRGGATAADVLELIGLVQTKVEEATGYRLEPEIHVIGRT